LASLVAEFATSIDGGLALYALVVRPWVALLGRCLRGYIAWCALRGSTGPALLQQGYGGICFVSLPSHDVSQATFRFGDQQQMNAFAFNDVTR
jgi:hypothetical protein